MGVIVQLKLNKMSKEKLIEEIQFHLKELDKGNIDKDDFVNAITEICSEETPTWVFDSTQPIIHLDEEGWEEKDSPKKIPYQEALDNHFQTMASMVRNLTKKK